jgi:hypothetical protein
MANDELYRAWLENRARVDVPAAFADRVLEKVHAAEARRGVAVLLWLRALLASRAGAIGFSALAGAAFLFRVLQLVGPFLAP